MALRSLRFSRALFFCFPSLAVVELKLTMLSTRQNAAVMPTCEFCSIGSALAATEWSKPA